MTFDPRYEREDDWIFQRYQLATGNEIRFAAMNVRRERNRVYARVSIYFNTIELAWWDFAIEDDQDRVRIANSAFGQMDGKSLDVAEFPKTMFKHALDIFCSGLWDEYIGDLVGGMMEGDIDTPPARRLIGDFVLQDASTILFAPPGEGKSNTAMTMAVCGMWANTSLWEIHDAWVPLYINVERSAASMASRLARINRALGLEPKTPIPFLNARGKSLADIYEAARKTIKKEGCRWVIYDSISRAGFGSLIQDDVANKITDMLNNLIPTWVALAHSPRMDSTHAFGSQMFDAAVDLTVQLQSQTASDGLSTGVGLQVIKANDIRKGPMQVHVFEWAEDGLIGIRPAKSREFAELRANERRSREDDAKAFLLQVGSATAQDVADHFGWARNHTSAMLGNANWIVKQTKNGKVIFSVRSERDDEPEQLYS